MSTRSFFISQTWWRHRWGRHQVVQSHFDDFPVITEGLMCCLTSEKVMVRHSTEPKNQPWSCNTWNVVFRDSGSVRVLQLLESVFRIFEGTKLQLWSLLQVLTLWNLKAGTDWCSMITDSVAYDRASEIFFPSIATRPDSEFRLECMHTTTS